MPKSNRPPQAARGKLLTLTGDVPGGNRTYTYDSTGRVRTMTDSEGYTLTYDYDNLDRVRVVTYPDASFEQFEFADHSLIATRDRAGDGLVPAPEAPRSPQLSVRWCAGRLHLRFLFGGFPPRVSEPRFMRRSAARFGSESPTGGVEGEAAARGALDAQVTSVVLAVVGAAEGDQVVGGVRASVFGLLEVVEIDEQVARAAGHDAAVVISGQD